MYPKTPLTADCLQLRVKQTKRFNSVSGKPFAVSVARQRGWLMPVAAFIVVVMGLLAAGMSVVSSQTAIGTAQEQISVQAFYAAEAGAQFGMSSLFYDTGSMVTRASATSACTSVNGSNIVFSAPGMQNCTADIACTANVDGANTTTFYQISSDGRCGSSPVNAQRIIDVSAYLQ